MIDYGLHPRNLRRAERGTTMRIAAPEPPMIDQLDNLLPQTNAPTSVWKRQDSSSDSSGSAPTHSCKPGDNSAFCQKPAAASNTATIVIVLCAV